jgi:hypothetical protein
MATVYGSCFTAHARIRHVKRVRLCPTGSDRFINVEKTLSRYRNGLAYQVNILGSVRVGLDRKKESDI